MEMEKTLDQDNPKFDMVNAKNRNEWVRVQSFSTFPTSSIDISLLSLAHAGFYYTGIDAECRCFSCGKVYKKWKDRDNPYIMHREISPNCLYMNGRESGNVPVDETDRDRPRPITNATLLTTVSDAGQEETVGVPGSGRRKVVVKLENIELEEKTESKGDKRESQDDRRRMRKQCDKDTSNDRRQYDEDSSSSTTDGIDNLHSYALTDETSKEAEIEMFGCTIPKTNIIDEHHSKVHYSTIILLTQLLRYPDLLKQIRKYFETIDYKGLTTVYKNLFCIDNLYQSLYVYPVVEAQWDLNDRPRVNHLGDNTYLSASGNLVCHPEEDQVQPNNALPDLLDGTRPITGIHGRWHRNSFEGNLVCHPEEDQVQPNNALPDLLDGPREVT